MNGATGRSDVMKPKDRHDDGRRKPISVRQWIIRLFLIFITWIRRGWLEVKQWMSMGWRYVSDAFAAMTVGRGPWNARGSGRYRGSRPRRPKILGVVLTSPLRGTPSLQALSRLIAWSKREKLKWILLYDPGGDFKRIHSDIVAAVRLTNLPGSTDIVKGWEGVDNLRIPNGESDPSSTSSTPNHHRLQDQDDTMRIILLSAEDAETPLIRVTNSIYESLKSDEQVRKDCPKQIHDEPAQIDERLNKALAAPQENKSEIEKTSGSAAVLEPDFILVLGTAFSLASFPPWAARTSELFHLKSLEEITSSRLDAVLQKFMRTRQRFGR